LSRRYSLRLRLRLGVRHKGWDTIRSPSVCGIIAARGIGSIAGGGFSGIVGGGFSERLGSIGASHVSDGPFPALGAEIRTVMGASEQSERVQGLAGILVNCMMLEGMVCIGGELISDLSQNGGGSSLYTPNLALANGSCAHAKTAQ